MERLEGLRARTPQMLDDLAMLVWAESPTDDVAATTACADVVAELGSRLLGREPERVVVDGHTHLRWGTGGVLLIGHFDTVWPVGTAARWPFAVDGDTATGPGCFDMKAGIVQGLHALDEIGRPRGVSVLLTCDEEIGSPTSEEVIAQTASDARAVLVLEPSERGALKVARKGVARYRVIVRGKASHAGLDPYGGRNALVELAHQVLAIDGLADRDAGTSVVPTTSAAGTTNNTVPERAWAEVNVRAWTSDELDRVLDDLRGLRPHIDGTSVEIEVGLVRPPLERTASADLFALAAKLADEIGIGPLEGAEVGGGSDGNLTAAMGVPTLDGLGAVGGGAHAEGEHIVVPAMAERAALVAALVGELV